MIFIDECHATGFFGKTGRGTEEFFGMKVGSSTLYNQVHKSHWIIRTVHSQYSRLLRDG